MLKHWSRSTAFLVVGLGTVGCATSTVIPPVTPHPPVQVEPKSSLVLAFMGDTGLDNPGRDSVVAAAAREPGLDLVGVAGDLVYPEGPNCPGGRAEGRSLEILDERIGRPFERFGVPVLLTMGNHDADDFPISWIPLFGRENGARTACYLDYAAQPGNAHLVLPAIDYVIDAGAAVIVVVDTNHDHLDEETATLVREAFQGHTGWKILLSHHGVKIYHDKGRESLLRSWLRAQDLHPDLVVNGHAHLQQFGVYDGILALTSGSVAKVRSRPSCDAEKPDLASGCGEGQLWGESVRGYARVEVDAGSLRILFKDGRGVPLWGCEARKGVEGCRALDSVAAPKANRSGPAVR